MNAALTRQPPPIGEATHYERALTANFRTFQQQVIDIVNPEVTTLASAITIFPQSSFVNVTGSADIETITVASNVLGALYLFAYGAWTMGTSGNIKHAVTATVGKVVQLIYDGTFWWPVMGA